MKPYEKEFKDKAVKIALEVGTAKAARDLGISSNTLYTWMNLVRKHGGLAHVGNGNSRQRSSDSDTANHTKRIRELEKVNQILKDALGFFAVSQKK